MSEGKVIARKDGCELVLSIEWLRKLYDHWFLKCLASSKDGKYDRYFAGHRDMLSMLLAMTMDDPEGSVLPDPEVSVIEDSYEDSVIVSLKRIGVPAESMLLSKNELNGVYKCIKEYVNHAQTTDLDSRRGDVSSFKLSDGDEG